MIPSSTLGLHLHDKEFRLCLQYWLGLRMSEEGATCPICHWSADPTGTTRWAVAGMEIGSTDMTSISLIGGGVSLQPWTYTLFPPCSSKHSFWLELPPPQDTPCRWARRGRWPSMRAAGVSFIPLVVESLGGWSYEAIQTIKSISHLQGQRLGLPPPDTTQHLFQHLAIALWKGNASLWVRRQPVRSAMIDGLV